MTCLLCKPLFDGDEKYVIEDKHYHCPYLDCNLVLQIDQVNCSIFRCGAWIGGVLLPPHASKAECESKPLLYGCGRPIKYNSEKDGFDKCDYI